MQTSLENYEVDGSLVDILTQSEYDESKSLMQ